MTQETFNKIDKAFDELWATGDKINRLIADLLIEHGDMELRQEARYICWDGRKLHIRWANAARCHYGKRIEVRITDDDGESYWSDLSNNETFFEENIHNLFNSISQALRP